MKNKKHQKSTTDVNMKDQKAKKATKAPLKTEKVKYKHMSHWLDDEDDDQIPINLYGEEE